MKKLFLLLFLGLASCQTVQKVRTTALSLLKPADQGRQIVLEPRWVRSTLAKDHLEYRRLNRMTPIVDDEHVFVGNGVDGIVAFNRKSGNELWRFPIKGGVEAGAQLLDQRLYFGANDGFFYALEATTGKEIWRASIRFEGLAKPIVRDGRVFVLAGNNVIYALDAGDGRQLWSYARPEGTTFTVRGGSQPAIHGQVVYLGFSDGALVALNLRDGSLIWERQLASAEARFKDVDATPVLDGDSLYVSTYDGSLYCLSRADGQIVWRFDEGSYNPVTISGEQLYYASTERKLINLNKQTGRVVWSRSMEKGLPTQPALYHGFLILGTHEGALEVRRTQDGQKVAHYSPGRGISAAPLAYGDEGEIYFISNEANLYAMRLTLKDARVLWPWDEVAL